MDLLQRFVRFFCRFGPGEKIWNRIRHPGIGIADAVSFDVQGEFRYGVGCSIGEGANIMIKSRAALLLGNDCYVGRYTELGPGGQISIGTDTSIQDRCILLGDVTVGRHCLLAPNVMISSGNHHFDLHPSWLIRDQDRYVRQDAQLSAADSKPVVIEDDCWLGINAVVMRGVTVGKGAIVGAGSVVVRDVTPYTVVGGVPAKEIKKRLSFIPPKRISGANPDDWPYFYGGFEVSQAALKKYAAYGGIAARDQFVLCLDASSGGALHLVVKSVDSPACELSVGGQRAPVSSAFEELIFARPGAFDAAARVRAEATPPGATLVVREAWIQ